MNPNIAGKDWRLALADLAATDTPHVLVTVISVDGSTPRDAGTKMVVTPDAFSGTIGGGNLEFQAIDIARTLLTDEARGPVLRTFPLGPELGQCCGGAVEIMFESFLEDRMQIFVYGAGHVGQAVADTLSKLDCRLHWIDTRPDIFPAAINSNVTVVSDEDPLTVAQTAPADAYHLIMTHSHDLDEEITAKILSSNVHRYCGLIGSQTKAARFRSRLKKRGLSAGQINRLTSPIGVDGIHGKTPAEIAIAVAAQILQIAGTSVIEATDRSQICGDVAAKARVQT